MDTMKDSGSVQSFETGAERDSDENKSRPELISPVAEERLADWLARGAKKRGDRNWEKGIPLMRTVASLKRHLLKFQNHEADEDHLAAILCNAMFLLHTHEMIVRGRLPITLDDRPDYSPVGPAVRVQAGKPTVYLAGPITGHRFDWEWREVAINKLTELGFYVRSPLCGREPGMVGANGFEVNGQPVSGEDSALRDEADIKASDIVLANLCPGYEMTRPPTGTLMEMGMARALGKHIIAVVPLSMMQHPFIREFTNCASDLAGAYTWAMIWLEKCR
jgi:nucleoside 2-deoxyribosyltransferase